MRTYGDLRSDMVKSLLYVHKEWVRIRAMMSGCQVHVFGHL